MQLYKKHLQTAGKADLPAVVLVWELLCGLKYS